MYNQKLVASLKANGKILREFKDTVYCPFGAEYSILLKNLNTVRAVVHVYIDGENMIPDGLVLNAGQEVDLERSIKNGNLNEGNRFKFIERTGAVEQHRGVKLEDGLIRIEYQFEIPRPVINIADKFRYTGIGGSSTGDYYNQPWYSTTATNTGLSGGTGDRFTLTASGSTSQMNVGGVLRGVDYSKGEATISAASAAIDKYCADNGIINQIDSHDGMATMDCNFNDAGITVPGSKSEQKFQTTYMNALDPQKFSIVLKILGETPDNEPVRKPITTKHKPKCVTCGKQNKATAKFCTECGTALEIFA
jgi:hypothetical protein